MKLYPYQEEGAAFLRARSRGYLADAMGLGKTLQALEATRHLDRILVVAPAAVVRQWEVEAQSTLGREIEVVSYAKLVAHKGRYRAEYRGREWDAVILDEAHYVKNRNAKRTHRALALAAEAGKAVLLSGTPMPNHPGELWAPLRALWPGVGRELGCESYSAWMRRFCNWKQTRWGPKVFGGKNLGQLQPYLDRLMLRRRVADVAQDLPPIRVDRVLIPRPGWAPELGEYEAEAHRTVVVDGEEVDATRLSRLRRLLGEMKAPLVGRQLDEELGDGAYDKLVLFFHHHTTADVLQRLLARHGVVRYDGRMAPGAKEAALRGFRERPDRRVFLAQMTAGGTGLNLQSASELVIVEPDWSPAVNAQAIKRIHRLGQTDPCRARIFAMAGTLDEGLMDVLVRKIRMAKELNLQGA